MHTRKILVTGGAGFIGSAVIRHIIQNTNDQVCNVDKLTYASNLENLLNRSIYVIAMNSKEYFPNFNQIRLCI